MTNICWIWRRIVFLEVHLYRRSTTLKDFYHPAVFVSLLLLSPTRKELRTCKPEKSFAHEMFTEACVKPVGEIHNITWGQRCSIFGSFATCSLLSSNHNYRTLLTAIFGKNRISMEGELWRASFAIFFLLIFWLHHRNTEKGTTR